MQKLFDHINKYTNVDEFEFHEIEPYFNAEEISKKETLYSAGSKALKHYFVLEGCLYMYFINDRGSEQTLQFAVSNWWITDYLAFQNKKSSEFYIKAVDKSKVLSIGYEQQEELLSKFPKMETYFRNIYQTAYGAALMRMKYIFDFSKEEIYFKFKEAFPEFVNNVPQYLVATYLGLSPEYLSKLRKKSIS